MGLHMLDMLDKPVLTSFEKPDFIHVPQQHLRGQQHLDNCGYTTNFGGSKMLMLACQGDILQYLLAFWIISINCPRHGAVCHCHASEE